MELSAARAFEPADNGDNGVWLFLMKSLREKNMRGVWGKIGNSVISVIAL